MTNSKCDIGLHVCDNISCINSLRLQVPSWKPGHTESRNIRVGDFFKFIFARLGCVTTIIISYLAIVLGNGTLVEHLSHFVLGNGTLVEHLWPIVLGNGTLLQGPMDVCLVNHGIFKLKQTLQKTFMIRGTRPRNSHDRKPNCLQMLNKMYTK